MGYSHWHDDPGDHPDPYRATPGTASAEDDYDLDGYSTADAARDDLRDKIANADDLFTT